MIEKLKSPIVWGTIFTSILTQLEILKDSETNGWTIAMAICTVLIALFGALNNPDSRDTF